MSGVPVAGTWSWWRWGEIKFSIGELRKMDVSKKISAYPENFSRSFSVCIDALRAVMYMPSPGPSRRASPTAGSWWSIFGRIAASQPVRRPDK